MEIEENEVRVAGFSGRDAALGVIGNSHDTVARIVLDEIFERHRQLAIVLDDQYLEHPRASPTTRKSPREIRDLHARPDWCRSESLVPGVIDARLRRRAQTK